MGFWMTDRNFNVITSGDNYTIWVDGGTDLVGIGTDTPSKKLTVEGSISASGNIYLQGSAKGIYWDSGS